MEQSKYKAEIVKRMKSIGTYKAEYAATVERLAELYVMIAEIKVAEFDDPSAKVRAMNQLYSQALAHEKELGLTPAALKKMDAVENKPKSSMLADALRAIG